MITNQVTRAAFELLGDPTAEGYGLTVGNEVIPIFLNKDKTTKYPAIRVAPFINKGDVRYDKYIDKSKRGYEHWEYGVFQVDIYTRNLIQAQKIYDVIAKRIFDFFNLETVVFNYTRDFQLVDEYTYKTIAYALLDDQFFKDVYGVRIDKKIIHRVHSLDDLHMNCFYVDDHFFYIKTDQNIKHIEIKMLMQGRLFSNGFAYSDNGLHDYTLSKQRNLSTLEDNEVERISFDLELLFSSKIKREKLPQIDKIIYPKPNVR
jgi:hypothetical protein